MKKYSFTILILTVLILTLFFVSSLVNGDDSNDYTEAMDLVGDYNPYQRRWMNEAWELTHDKEFMYMLKAENGLLNHDRRHDPSHNTYGVDWGFCGVNDYYHKDLVGDPRFLTDPLWQIEQCYALYKGGTKFYAIDRMKRDPNFKASITKHFIFF